MASLAPWSDTRATDIPSGAMPAPQQHRSRPLVRFGGLAWVAYAAGMIWFAAQDVGLQGQYLLGGLALAAIVLLHLLRPTGALRVTLILLIIFTSVRYFTWRTLHTIPPVDSASFVPGLLLYLAELQGMTVYVLGVFVNIRPINRPEAPLPADPGCLPTVDVLVPSYNEETELLRVTLTAATQIRYPAGKLVVCLLDDGGTEQKRADPDPGKAAVARERHATLQALCAELGVTYLTRSRNIGAKAGNINAALPRTRGDLLLILDADHVPSQDILERTVGHFLRDPELFLVQTPHFFINPDPIEHNLGTFRTMPGESEMFYGVVQKGLDSWNSSFFCGSAAVLRRAPLIAAGGVADTSITEDAETALELHALGYKSLYVDHPMVAGLSPGTFSAFVTQRIRWAQGMFQILLLKNPLFKRGLTVPQRLCYLSSSMFWLFPFVRLTFLIAPLFYLVFGLRVFEATLDEFLAFAVFHVVTSLMLSNFLFGSHRRPFVSDLYELLQSVFTIGALASVVLNPRKPEFRVTPKAENVQSDFISQLAWPFFVIIMLLLVATALGVLRYFDTPLERDHLVIVLSWNSLNLVLALAAVGVMFERARARTFGAIGRNKPVNLVTRSGAVRATLVDTTTKTGRLVIEGDLALSGSMSENALLQVNMPGQEELTDLRIAIDRVHGGQGRAIVDIRYVPASSRDEAELIRLCYGDSNVWAAFQASRRRQVTVAGGLFRLAGLGARRTLELIGALLRGRSLDKMLTPPGPAGFADISGQTTR